MKAPWYRRPAATPPLRGAAMVVIVMIVALVGDAFKYFPGDKNMATNLPSRPRDFARYLDRSVQ